ncbi:NADPH-dependent FMN reductase [Marinomonas dokdonensis]|uniref:NADPH-dependent FMN reductase n=1 Tax=Marinomonas dokdonensis TaxID=328224 RepID=UPI0040554AD7
MKIVAFAASSSRHSINKALASYAGSLLPDAEVKVLDLNDFEMPIFSVDKEATFGVPPAAHEFLAEIASADGLIIGFAEHNGNYAASYKNTFDWASRVEKKVYQNKPILALATSPGPGGARNVLQLAESNLPHFNGRLIGSLSVPSYHQAMQDGELVDAELKQTLQSLVDQLAASI